MKMQVLPLSHVDGYVAKPIQKIYSTKCIKQSQLRSIQTVNAKGATSKALSRVGEIALTKKCDTSLLYQAKKLGANMVLGAGYSFSMDDTVFGYEFSNSVSDASMYAYGEAVKLIPKSKDAPKK